METGRVRVERELSRLRHVIRDDGEYASQVKKPEPHGEPADAREKVEQPEPAKPAWMPAYEALRQDWNELVKMVRQSGEPLFYAKGYMDMIPRIRELMENPDIPAKSQAPLIQALENHQRYLSTRKHILDYPGEAERHMDARASLKDVAADREVEPAGVPAYPDWRQEAERLTAAGEAILSGKGTYGAHLDRIVDAGTRMEGALSVLREVIGEDDEELAERKARELRRLQNRHLAGPRFAMDDGATQDPARAMSSSAAPVRTAFSRLGHAIGHLVGGRDYHDRLRTATFAREVLERAEVLKRDWNRQVDRAAEGGVHVIYTDGYDHLHKELDTVSKRHAPGSRRQIGDKRRARSGRQGQRQTAGISTSWRESHGAISWTAARRWRPRRPSGAWRFPAMERYDTWRNVTRRGGGPLRGNCMDDRGDYGIHLDYIAHAQESLGSALARVREVLEDDDRHLAAALAGQSEGERHPDARGAHRPPPRRSGEAPGIAATTRRAQGRKAAAEQGPAIGACESSPAWPRRRRDDDCPRLSDGGNYRACH